MDPVSTGSGSDLVKPWESRITKEIRMLITDQVATAPCTDPVQEVSGLWGKAMTSAFNL